MTVELIYDRDCPHVAQTRANLLHALSQMNLPVKWVELEKSSPDNPEYVARCGSPTVLVDGHDIAASCEPGAPCCRLYYSDSGRPSGAPGVDLIRAALGRCGSISAIVVHHRAVRHSVLAIPGIGVALLPKLACPLCWPAYAALVSALGLGFLLTAAVLFWLTAIFLLASILMLAIGSRRRHGYGPAVAATLASLVILIGKFGVESERLAYGGIAVLIAAALWNAWPRHSTDINNCAPCGSAGYEKVEFNEREHCNGYETTGRSV